MIPKVRKALIYLAAADFLACGEAPRVEVGELAPSFRLKRLDGTWVESDVFAGSIVVLNFWQTYCGPCLKEIPELEKVAAASGVEVVGINLDKDGLKTLAPFVKRQSINYTVLLGDETVFQRFDGFGIPYTLVLDREQKIAKIYRGSVTRETLDRDLQVIM